MKTTKTKTTKTTSGKLTRQTEFLSLLHSHHWNVSATCLDMGLSRNTVKNWIAVDAKFQDRLECAKQTEIDDVEQALLEQIKKGDTTATIFYLKTRGKSRGYVEREPSPGRKVNGILCAVLAGNKTVTEAAYDFAMLGQPLPEVLKIQLTKAAAVEDSRAGGATEDELNRKYNEAIMRVSQQILELPERKAVVDGLKAQVESDR